MPMYQALLLTNTIMYIVLEPVLTEIVYLLISMLKAILNVC